MRTYIPIKYLYSLILIITGSLYNAQSLIAYGTDWTLAPTITEAGTNYTGTYETSATAPYQMTLTVSMPALLGAATVTVRYMNDPIWDNSLGLAVKRLNNGTSLCVLCSLIAKFSLRAQHEQ